MNADHLIKRAEKAHRLSEAECRQLIPELEEAITAGNERLNDLDYDGITREPHPARAAALEAGVEAVIAADREVEELTATLQLLEHHLGRVQKAAEAARVREAPVLAREALKAIPGAAHRLAKAREEVAAAKAQLEAAVAKLSQARQASTECPVMTTEQFDAIADHAWPLTGAANPDAVQRLRGEMRERLTGVAPPRVERWIRPDGSSYEVVVDPAAA